MAISDYKQEEFSFIKAMNKMTLINGFTPVIQPKAYLLGGQSGAGKTMLHLLATNETEDNLVIIDGDTFRKGHPSSDLITNKYGKEDVKYTAKFAGQMVEELMEELSEAKFNLLIEGTLRTVDVPLKTVHLLNQKGYKTELFVMAVHPILSYLGTISRYEEAYAITPELARATPKEHHDLIVEKLPENLDTLYKLDVFSTIRLFNRSGATLYNQQDTPEKSPKQIMDAIIESNLTEEETDMAMTVIKRTNELIEQRDKNNSETQFIINELKRLAEIVVQQRTIKGT